MKKNYFMLALATMMMAACANNDLVDDLVKEEAPQAIGFETFAQKATRAENSEAGYEWQLESHHKTFKVWGGKRLNDDTLVPVYGIGDEGTVTHDGTKWTATPTKYWDKAAKKYDFFAVAPANQNWNAELKIDKDFSSGFVTLNDFKLNGVNLSVENSSTGVANNWINKQDVDLLISENTPVGRSHYTTDGNTNVHLNFSHILSRLNIIVCKGEDITAEVVVTNLIVDKLNNEGSFNENLATATATSPGSIARWKDQEGSYSITGYNNQKVTKAKDTYLLQSLVIPQTITSTEIDVNGTTTDQGNQAYFKIEYTIDGEPFYGYYNLAAAFGASSFNFGEGWQNTLTIVINPTGITFTGSVAEWAVVEKEGNID